MSAQYLLQSIRLLWNHRRVLHDQVPEQLCLASQTPWWCSQHVTRVQSSHWLLRGNSVCYPVANETHIYSHGVPGRNVTRSLLKTCLLMHLLSKHWHLIYLGIRRVSIIDVPSVNFAFAYIDPSSLDIVPMDGATPGSLFKDTANIKSIKSSIKVWISVGGW